MVCIVRDTDMQVLARISMQNIDMQVLARISMQDVCDADRVGTVVELGQK